MWPEIDPLLEGVKLIVHFRIICCMLSELIHFFFKWLKLHFDAHERVQHANISQNT